MAENNRWEVHLTEYRNFYADDKYMEYLSASSDIHNNIFVDGKMGGTLNIRKKFLGKICPLYYKFVTLNVSSIKWATN